jgi:hypothetical protein
MSQELHDFDNPWRPIYEWRQSFAWFAATIGCVLTTVLLPLPPNFGLVMSAICVITGMLRLHHAWERSSDKWRANFAEKEFIDIPALRKITENYSKKKQVWLGHGFQWTDIEANKMHALINGGVANLLGKSALHADGSYWIHGVEKEQDIAAELQLLEGHTLIVGATGVGKTRLFDLLIAQAIMRGEPVVIIDPKGDHGLAENARRVCEEMGFPEKFVYFNPAHPDKSASIDPLRNWNRKTELASRVATLVPSETGADPFTAFAWKVLNDIVGGLISIGVRPNLVLLRRYIEGGPEDLLTKALRVHFRNKVKDWESKTASYIKRKKGDVLEAYVEFYREVVVHDAPNVDLAGLISTYEHNREHFQKMIASLIPILSMLTSDPLKDLLSPEMELPIDSASKLPNISGMISDFQQTLFQGAYDVLQQAGGQDLAGMVFQGAPGNLQLAAGVQNLVMVFQIYSIASLIGHIIFACKQEEFEWAMNDRWRLCSYVDTCCSKKVFLIGCVEKRKLYCCFKSIAARVISEQIVKKNLTGTKPWGFRTSPSGGRYGGCSINCGGLSPTELAVVDWSQVDMTEWTDSLVESGLMNVSDPRTNFGISQNKIQETMTVGRVPDAQNQFDNTVPAVKSVEILSNNMGQVNNFNQTLRDQTVQDCYVDNNKMPFTYPGCKTQP